MSVERNKNVTVLLMDIEYGSRKGRCRNPYRAGLKVLSNLVASGEREYRKTMDIKAGGGMMYGSKLLVQKDIKKGYRGYGQDLKLQVAFDVKQWQEFKHLRNFAHVYVNPDTVPLPNEGHRSCVTALSMNNWLLRLSLETWQVLERVCLLPPGSQYLFKEIDSSGHIAELAIKAGLNPTAAQRNCGDVAAFALFKMAPLRFVGMFKMNKKVFGNSLMDAETNADLLFAHHKRHCIDIYSLEQIVNMFLEESAQLGQKVGSTGKMCGSDTDGLPFNIHITEDPPVLIHVTDSTSSLQFGGNPWHYLSMSPKDQTLVRCFSLETGRQLEGNETICSEPPEDCCVFHDDSIRIISICRRECTAYLIVKGTKPGSCRLEKQFSFAVDNMYSNPSVRPYQTPTVTASGRVVKWNRLIEWTSPVHLPKFGYEDELGLMYTSFSMIDKNHCYGTVTFYNNESGQRLHHVELTKRQRSCKESCIKEVAVDEDIIVDLDTVIVNRKDACSSAEIFRLFEPFEDENLPLEDMRKCSGNVSPDKGRPRGSRQHGEGRNQNR